MKKKILLITSLALFVLAFSGCFKRDDLEDVTIYTSVYPIEYLTDRLYGYNSEILSIYPNGENVHTYSLSDKQIKDYSNSSVFIYNGLSNEKEIAREFVNTNKKIKIIDVSYGLKYTYGVEELWLSPNNYLMLASNIKSSLFELINSKYIKEEIQTNFDVFEEDISLIDADLRSIASSSAEKNKNNLLIASDVLQFLNNYGFDTALLKNEEDMSVSIKNNLKKGTYKYILITDDTEQSDYLKEVIETYKLNVVTIRTMSILSDEERKSNENYLTFMKNFLEQLKNICLEKE